MLDAAAAVLDSVIAPAMAEVDRTEVPRSHLDALAAIGALGLSIPDADGLLPAPAAVGAELQELIAGACPSTSLIASQHATPAGWMIASGRSSFAALLAAMARGERIGGAAFGHVRSWPRRHSVSARRVEGGWLLDGNVPWFSGDGLADVLGIAAIAQGTGEQGTGEHGADEVVFAILDLPDPAVVATPLALAAIGGSRTSALELTGAFVPDERVTQRTPFAQWLARDGVGGPLGLPGALGLARAAIADALARYPDDEHLGAMADEVAELRAISGAPLAAPLSAAQAAAGQTSRYWRARATNLAVRATNAAIVARGGGALLQDDPAQVRARAAMFLQVRGVSDALRVEHFAALSGFATRP